MESTPLFHSTVGADTPRRLLPYSIAWIVIAMVVVVDWIGVSVVHAHLIWGDLRSDGWGFGALLSIALWGRIRVKNLSHAASIWAKRLSDLVYTVQWMLVLAAFATSASILTILSVMARFPLIDDQLDKFDRSVGFDWLALYHWVNRHYGLIVAFRTAYATLLVQTVLVPVILGLLGRRIELVRHILYVMLASLACISVATVVPATSAFLHYHVSDPGTAETVSTFFPFYLGSLRVIDLSDMQGLVSMPSMHAAMAILFTYSLRKIPRLAVPSLLVNTTMFVSTPVMGGHYLPDVIAGAMLAWFAIAVVNAKVPRLGD